MFGKRFELFRLLGFSVKVDLSWIIIVVLVTWSLAEGLFRVWQPELPGGTRWAMGVAGALGLFASIILHELSHSLAARRQGIPMKGITLFIFGGVAEMDREPPSPKAEFMMAIAGPIASVVIAAFCFAVTLAVRFSQWPAAVTAVIAYLAWINAVLVAFNVIPAFPLDGGRVLRSALWYWKGNIRWATRITSEIGSGFGIVLILGGIYFFVFLQNFVGGIWWFLLGLFLRNAAQMSYQQLLIRRALEGERVERFMNEDPIMVPPHTTVEDLVENYIYQYHYKMFPVVDRDRLVGCVSTRDVRAVPRHRWGEHTVGDIVDGCSSENTIHVDADAMEALAQMNRTSNSRLMVVADDNRLEGVIALKDLLRFLSLKLDLEEDAVEAMDGGYLRREADRQAPTHV